MGEGEEHQQKSLFYQATSHQKTQSDIVQSCMRFSHANTFTCTCSVNCSFNCNGTQFSSWQWWKRALERSNGRPCSTCYHHFLRGQAWSKSHSIFTHAHIPQFIIIIIIFLSFCMSQLPFYSVSSTEHQNYLHRCMQHEEQRQGIWDLCTVVGLWPCWDDRVWWDGPEDCSDTGSLGRTGWADKVECSLYEGAIGMHGALPWDGWCLKESQGLVGRGAQAGKGWATECLLHLSLHQ